MKSDIITIDSTSQEENNNGSSSKENQGITDKTTTSNNTLKRAHSCMEEQSSIQDVITSLKSINKELRLLHETTNDNSSTSKPHTNKIIKNIIDTAPIKNFENVVSTSNKTVPFPETRRNSPAKPNKEIILPSSSKTASHPSNKTIPHPSNKTISHPSDKTIPQLSSMSISHSLKKTIHNSFSDILRPSNKNISMRPVKTNPSNSNIPLPSKKPISQSPNEAIQKNFNETPKKNNSSSTILINKAIPKPSNETPKKTSSSSTIVINKAIPQTTNETPKKTISSSTNVTNQSKPQLYVNKRIAKMFGVEVYFGTVTPHYETDVEDGTVYWKIIYDDGDSEEFDYKDLEESLLLYEKKKNKDPGYLLTRTYLEQNNIVSDPAPLFTKKVENSFTYLMTPKIGDDLALPTTNIDIDTTKKSKEFPSSSAKKEPTLNESLSNRGGIETYKAKTNEYNITEKDEAEKIQFQGKNNDNIKKEVELTRLLV